MISASEHPGVISDYLKEELRAKRIINMGSAEEARKQLGGALQPLWGNSKKHRPNKWRLIVNLSAPEGNSVNDGISKELASLSYVKVDDVVAHARAPVGQRYPPRKDGH